VFRILKIPIASGPFLYPKGKSFFFLRKKEGQGFPTGIFIQKKNRDTSRKEGVPFLDKQKNIKINKKI
jgi:hypothetical protein